MPKDTVANRVRRNRLTTMQLTSQPVSHELADARNSVGAVSTDSQADTDISGTW